MKRYGSNRLIRTGQGLAFVFGSCDPNVRVMQSNDCELLKILNEDTDPGQRRRQIEFIFILACPEWAAGTTMIAKSEPTEFETIYEIINDAASAYRGIIPDDRWHEPYMSREELKKQMAEGVEFWHYSENGGIMAVMGIQFKVDVTLIRHAYTRTENRNKGIGSKLLKHLLDIARTPVLIGTWADAGWAITFYQKHGFRLLPVDEKNSLLHTYWSIPERQVETSVVLASVDWKNRL